MYNNSNNVNKRKPGRPPGSKNKRKRKSVKKQEVKAAKADIFFKETIDTIQFHLCRIHEELHSLSVRVGIE